MERPEEGVVYDLHGNVDKSTAATALTLAMEEITFGADVELRITTIQQIEGATAIPAPTANREVKNA
ncbi:hypothetical protein AB0O47_40025 [Streptomyces noursei]|uniref:hypothetical protein n=1 Tax=Streptomyces noursei TaxID=1971 RepID=UPI00344FC2E2